MGPGKVPGEWGGKGGFRERWMCTAVGCARAPINTMRAEGAFVLVVREDADKTPMMMPPSLTAPGIAPTGL